MKKIILGIFSICLLSSCNLQFYQYYGKYYGVAADFNFIKKMIEEDVKNGAIHPLVANDYIKQIDSLNIKIKDLAKYGKKPLSVKLRTLNIKKNE